MRKNIYKCSWKVDIRVAKVERYASRTVKAQISKIMATVEAVKDRN